MGIEPTRPAWKAGVLPLNYTRRMKIYCVDLTSMLIFDRSTVNLLLESTSSVHPQNESSLRRVTSVLTFDGSAVILLHEKHLQGTRLMKIYYVVLHLADFRW